MRELQWQLGIVLFQPLLQPPPVGVLGPPDVFFTCLFVLYTSLLLQQGFQMWEQPGLVVGEAPVDRTWSAAEAALVQGEGD